MASYTCCQRSPTDLSVAYGCVHLSSAISNWLVSGLWLCTLVVSNLQLTCQWLMAVYTCRQRSPTDLSVAYGCVHLSSAISNWLVSGLWLCTLVVSNLRLNCQWLMALYTCRQRSPTDLSVALSSILNFSGWNDLVTSGQIYLLISLGMAL